MEDDTSGPNEELALEIYGKHWYDNLRGYNNIQITIHADRVYSLLMV